jgi:MoaA/NifB/PqqE/SkfB family radical SAM enzyme
MLGYTESPSQLTHISEIHDMTRGIEGGWGRVVEAKKQLKLVNPKIIINIATMLTKYNISSVDKQLDWIRDLGVFSVMLDM